MSTPIHNRLKTGRLWQSSPGYYGEDTRQRHGFAGVNKEHTGVREWTAEDLAIEHTQQKQIIGIRRRTRKPACAINTR